MSDLDLAFKNFIKKTDTNGVDVSEDSPTRTLLNIAFLSGAVYAAKEIMKEQQWYKELSPEAKKRMLEKHGF